MNNLSSEEMTALLVKGRQLIERQLAETFSLFAQEKAEVTFLDQDGKAQTKKLTPVDLLARLKVIEEETKTLGLIQHHVYVDPADVKLAESLQRLKEKISEVGK